MLFGALGTPRLESWTAWGLQVGVLEGFQASKLRSIERFGPRSWGLWSAPGLQVGFLRWILASKLGSRDTFWPPDAAGNHVRTQFSGTGRNFKKQLKNIGFPIVFHDSGRLRDTKLSPADALVVQVKVFEALGASKF